MEAFTYKGISDGKYVEGDIEAINLDEEMMTPGGLNDDDVFGELQRIQRHDQILSMEDEEEKTVPQRKKRLAPHWGQPSEGCHRRPVSLSRRLKDAP